MKKAQLELCSPEKSRGKGSFGLACCLDGEAGTRGRRLTEGEGMGTRGKAMVGTRAGLIMSWVSCCNCAIRPVRVVLIACSEAFWHLVSSWR